MPLRRGLANLTGGYTNPQCVQTENTTIVGRPLQRHLDTPMMSKFLNSRSWLWLMAVILGILLAIFCLALGKPSDGVLARLETEWGEFFILRSSNGHSMEPYSEALWLRDYGGGFYEWPLDTMSYGFFSHSGLRLKDRQSVEVSLFPSTWMVHRETNGWYIVDGEGRRSALFIPPEDHIPKKLLPLPSRHR